MKFLSSGFFILTFWTLVFFVLFSFSLWCAYDEILDTASLVGEQINLNKDINKALKQLLAENKLISAKDYFGFYISYYNNFVLILSAIVGLFGISSFVYLKRKNDENMRDIEVKTREEVRTFLKDKEVEIKKIIAEVAKEYSKSQTILDNETIAKDVDMLKEQVEQLISKDYGNEEISLQKHKEDFTWLL